MSIEATEHKSLADALPAEIARVQAKRNHDRANYCNRTALGRAKP